MGWISCRLMYCSFLLLLQVIIISSALPRRRSGRIRMEMFLVFLQLLFLVVSIQGEPKMSGLQTLQREESTGEAMNIWSRRKRSLLDDIYCIGDTKCDPELGCFTNKCPYKSLTRPISEPPRSPKEINTQFLLLTNKKMDDFQVLSARNRSTITQSHFDGQKETVYIVHGFLETGRDHWPKTMCKTILMKEDVNCICVDWSGGSVDILYTRAINSVQVVGAEMALFINITRKEFNCSLNKTHIIAHSLGAQAAGEAGKRCPGIEKFTLLDAAGPCFEHESDEVVCDRSDAKFVLALHTDSGTFGLGMKRLIGHMDVFVNGGEHMTGCDGSQIQNISKSTNLIAGARDVVLCNHVNSYYMFIESILKPKGFMAYCASSHSAFQQGEGFPCTNGKCSLVGYYTQPQNASSCRVYYLNTGPRYDFARYRYHITVVLKGDQSTHGSITVALYNSSDYHADHKIHGGSISGGSVYSAFVDSPCPPPVIWVTVMCETSPIVNLLHNPTILAESVNVMSGTDGTEYKFCGGETVEKGTQKLDPCPKPT